VISVLAKVMPTYLLPTEQRSVAELACGRRCPEGGLAAVADAQVSTRWPTAVHAYIGCAVRRPGMPR